MKKSVCLKIAFDVYLHVFRRLRQSPQETYPNNAYRARIPASPI